MESKDDDSKRLEDFVELSLSPDETEAFILLKDHPPAFTSADLADVLSSRGIIYGVRHDILDEMAAHPGKYTGESVLVAKGDKPQRGKDGYIHLLYDKETEYAPLEREDGTIDYREIRRLNNVKKGQPVAERIPAEPGTDGMTVKGERIPASPGKESWFKIGKNVVTDPKRRVLYAAIDGLVTFTEYDKINVFPVYEVNGDVDYRVGNIDFVGTVVVRGNVLPGFSIRASGDIRIIGGVEAAVLEADGSIEITEGILGQNKGFVHAAGDVKCSFMQDAHVKADRNVIVQQSIMHSRVEAGKEVKCTGNKGLIVGGHILAGEKIAARTVGNPASTATVLEVGLNPELKIKVEKLRHEIKTLQENERKASQAVSLLDKMAAAGTIARDKLELRMKLKHSVRQYQEQIQASKEKLLKIEKALESSTQAEVLIQSTVYGGTKIVLGRFSRHIREPVKGVKFRIVDGDISMISNL